MGYRGAEQSKKHLRFDELPLEEGKKMKKYRVINESLAQVIGIIHFRGGWRQYVFRADQDVDMSRSCHKEINKFIDTLMDDWKESLKQRRIK